MESTNKTIGFIGLGIMGIPMAKNLIKSNFNLIVYNRTDSKTKELAKLGASVAKSPAEVASQSNYIITISGWTSIIIFKNSTKMLLFKELWIFF